MSGGDEEAAGALTGEVVSGLATQEDYAAAIRESYRDAVEAIFRTGDLLIEAKENLPHGEYGEMVDEKVPFGRRTSRKLRRIARDPRLRNRTKWSDLPPAWTTLHRLATLDDGQWERIEPHLSPDLTGSEIPELVAKGAQRRLMTAEEQGADEKLEAALQELPYEHRRWAKSKLQRISPVTKVRVARGLAEADPEVRDRLIELDESEVPPRDREEADDLQMVLPGFAMEAREELLERDALDGSRVAGARSALNLKALVRWAEAFADRTDPEAVVDGLWAVRDPERVAERARRLAEWMTELATDLEFEQAFREMEPRRPED